MQSQAQVQQPVPPGLTDNVELRVELNIPGLCPVVPPLVGFADTARSSEDINSMQIPWALPLSNISIDRRQAVFGVEPLRRIKSWCCVIIDVLVNGVFLAGVLVCSSIYLATYLFCITIIESLVFKLLSCTSFYILWPQETLCNN